MSYTLYITWRDIMMLHLKGKTQKGKNRVREHGTQWVICRMQDRVAFSNKLGPWWLIKPVNGFEKDSRWICNTHDDDFEVII